MNRPLEYNIHSAQSRFVRPVTPRSIASQWREACGEALAAGAVVFELATRRAHISWLAYPKG